MLNFFTKNSKKNDVNADSELLKTILRFDEEFKTRFQEKDDGQAKNTNCCVSLFSCLKSASDNIPPEYKDIISWLTKLAITQVQGELNQEVLVSALIASATYAAQDTTGSNLPAEILTGLIEEIAGQFELELDIEPDYPALQAYCDENRITIPDSILEVINASVLTNAA